MAGAILIVIDVLAFILLVWLGWRVYETVAPLFLFPRGEFEKARALYEKTERRAILSSTRSTARYGVAICDLQMGRVDESLKRLRALPYDTMNTPMRFGIDLAIGSALLQLERSHEEMRQRFMRAAAVQKQPDIVLGVAHAELYLDNVERAEELYAEALEIPPEGKTMFSLDTLVRRSGTMVEYSATFLQGWYLARTGRTDEAGPLLQQVAAWPVRSWITQKAESLLVAMCVPTGTGEVDPASTAPMIVDARDD
ncbi:MAG: tetratricopeptide repeat protein [Polyangiaceae bacterium]|nr:tetratricopeptide repeat protein [Polyangiaceae bacterium]